MKIYYLLSILLLFLLFQNCKKKFFKREKFTVTGRIYKNCNEVAANTTFYFVFDSNYPFKTDDPIYFTTDVNGFFSYDFEKRRNNMVSISSSIQRNKNFYRFKLNDDELWGKFENVGVNLKPTFICEEINDIDIENKIRITGKIWNTLINWFKVKTGIYQMQAKNIFVFTELGQLKQISEGDVIEVLHSDENRIKIKHKEIIYLIKQPVYYWFNWYFIKIT